MRRGGCVALVLLLGCSGVRVPQPDAPPPRAERAQPAETAPSAGATTTTSARVPLDEAATEVFLDHEIERRRYVPPAPISQTVAAPSADATQWDRSWGDDRGAYSSDSRSRFPWSTAVGAGLGAIIGNQHGDSGQGAAIGAGIGLLLDLGRWL